VLKAGFAAAVAVVSLGSLAVSPAQAASTVCNSGRLCLYYTDGSMENVADINAYGGRDGVVMWCDEGKMISDRGFYQARNRTNRNINFYYSADGLPTWPLPKPTFTLGVNQSATFNAASVFYYCAAR
jgi:hypothetical protein